MTPSPGTGTASATSETSGPDLRSQKSRLIPPASLAAGPRYSAT
jgi:hypothetical protein